MPVAVVENVQYNYESINSTHAELTWDAIAPDVHRIRGFFRGYQVNAAAGYICLIHTH